MVSDKLQILAGLFSDPSTCTVQPNNRGQGARVGGDLGMGHGVGHRVGYVGGAGMSRKEIW